MQRKLPPSTTLDSLKKDAKRWLKALRADNPEARRRLEQAYPKAPPTLTLRAVQHALARVYGHENWKALTEALRAIAAQPALPEPVDTASPVHRFLEYACPDHHVRGRTAHRMASHAAMRFLTAHPEIARANLYTAVVCGDRDEVARILREDPQAANRKHASGGRERSGAGRNFDFLGDFGAKDWEPLLYLCFTRLPLATANDNAVEIAQLLLDHGADPNAHYMAGDSRYTPLTGVVGEGEEGRPPHPRRDELARLLLERGAEPYDSQVIYNIHFQGDTLWWVKLMHEFSHKAGRAADWQDPEWHMLDQGGYGTGARWHLREAVKHNDRELTQWCLEHGANPNTPPETDPRFPQSSLYEYAVRLGHLEIAELLLRYGAQRVDVPLDDETRFVAACLRLDRDAVQAMLALHPEYLRSPKAIFAAARGDNADAVAYLLDLGTPIEIEDGQRPLHVAASRDAIEVAALLLSRGAAVDPYDRSENTPIDMAVYYGHTRMVELLTPHSRDIWSLTPLGAVDRMRDVLAAEPALAKIVAHTTPLFWLPDDEAAALEIVKIFLQHGADPYFRDARDGDTAADRARKRGMRQVAALIDAPRAAPSPASADSYRQAAQDLVAAYEGDAAALERLNRHYQRTFTMDDLKAEIWRRNYAFRQRSSRVAKNSVKPEEAQLIVAQDAGFGNFTALLAAAAAGNPPQVPPFSIDPMGERIAPAPHASRRLG
ncbi:MAG: ankyrin repeat domain-containing protein [Candidatus Solibacter sp.]